MYRKIAKDRQLVIRIDHKAIEFQNIRERKKMSNTYAIDCSNVIDNEQQGHSFFYHSMFDFSFESLNIYSK